MYNLERCTLKVKLMLRRPYNQLVAQGIMPPLKTPIAFHEQAKQLERRKTGEILKAKIQQRPGRDELVRQHILEDVGHVDPSLAQRQRMLKKARLADQLNDQLSHRPGPLELIQKNILHTEEPIERAVKEGHIPFKATCEGHLTKPQHPNHYINFEDDSQSSEGGTTSSSLAGRSSATATNTQTTIISTSDMAEKTNPSAGIVTVSLSIPANEAAIIDTPRSSIYKNSETTRQQEQLLQSTAVTKTTIQNFTELCNSVVGGQELQTQPIHQHIASHLTESPLLISIASPVSSICSTTTTLFPVVPASSPLTLSLTTPNISIAPSPASLTTVTTRLLASPISTATVSQHKSDAPGKDKNRKKSKSKTQSKTRTIKFHEYKGPPNAQKLCASSSTLSASQQNETSYELLLQQQQLFLQWQVEFKNKYPQLILPAAQKPISLTSSKASECSNVSGANINIPSPTSSNTSSNVVEQPPLRPLGKLEDMKVSDLKAELKRRNLPVSGSKPQLIERLKPFTETLNTSLTSGSNNQHVTQMGHILMDTPLSMSTDDSNSFNGSNSPKDDCVTSPRIDSHHESEQDDSSSPPGDNVLKEHYRKKIEELEREIFKMRSQQQVQKLQNHPVRAEKLALQQHLQNKMQQQQLTRHLQQLQQLQQQQNQQIQQQARNLSFQSLNAKASLAAFLQTQQNNSTAFLDSTKLTSINNKKNQIKTNNSTTVQMPTAIVLNLAKPAKLNGSILGALVAQAQSQHVNTNTDRNSPAPQYDEQAKLLKVKIEPLQKNPIKSQMVDDVLEILINSGELPPSAAQEPVTPTTPNRKIPQCLILNASVNSPKQSSIFSTVMSPIDVTQNECDSPASQPKSSPQPPLPQESYNIQLSSTLQKHQQQNKSTNFTPELENSEVEFQEAMVVSPQLVERDSPDPQPPQEVTSSNNLDLKELGLDLDTMDFGQLYCDFGVKMETHQELMDIGDITMESDEPDWLESLIPESPPCPSTTAIINTLNLTENPTTSSNQGNNDIFDPLLSNSEDPFELFNIEDSEFKITSESPLSWDNERVDSAS